MATTKDKAELRESQEETAEQENGSLSRSKDSLYLQESKWFEQLDRNILLHLEDHLITGNVKLIYPEV